jgi:hypothetical protein
MTQVVGKLEKMAEDLAWDPLTFTGQEEKGKTSKEKKKK